MFKNPIPIMMVVALITAIVIFISSPAFPHECNKSETVVIGDKHVVVNDPLALLRQARNGGAKKTNIEYVFLGCHPVLETIAKDNDMSCQEFLHYTGVLKSFNDAFEDLIPILPPSQVQRTYNALLQQVVDSVVEQILAPRSAI